MHQTTTPAVRCISSCSAPSHTTANLYTRHAYLSRFRIAFDKRPTGTWNGHSSIHVHQRCYRKHARGGANAKAHNRPDHVARMPRFAWQRPKSSRPKSFKRMLEGHATIFSMIFAAVERMRTKVNDSSFLAAIGLTSNTADTQIDSFTLQLETALSESRRSNFEWASSRTYHSLRTAYERGSDTALEAQLHFLMQEHVANSALAVENPTNHARLADLRYPYEWYPSARELNRQIHLHVGPTNSGKTYHALKRLEQSNSGVYAGPLRLLAHEVYRRLNESGKPCNLITGDEIVAIEGVDALMSSCTVEMVPIGKLLDVAVIDEIQMIGHAGRGWAWTQALLGLRAKEVHLCGEERAMPLIRELTAAMGDTLHIHRYERLSPLKTMSASLEGDLRSLRKGDCLVTFSRQGIHTMKHEIERLTKKKVAVIYGSLPPEVRAQQAKLFNDPHSDYDILVASDAVGMGLNLNIKRMVFESTAKFFDGQYTSLPPSDIKQIAGRAGRYRVAPDVVTTSPGTNGNVKKTQEVSSTSSSSTLGLVTSLDRFDLPVINRAMATDIPPITSAGILPPDDLVVRFASYFPPQTPFSYVLQRLHDVAKMRSRFHLCQVSDAMTIADAIQGIKGLSIHDRIVFCAAPANLKEPGLIRVVQAYARCVEKQCGGSLLEIEELQLQVVDQDGQGGSHLRRLEALHKALILYLWLSYRFKGIFVSQAMAFHIKKLVEGKFDQALSGTTYSVQRRERSKKQRETATLQALEDRQLQEAVDHA